jgi:hypothetical protein
VCGFDVALPIHFHDEDQITFVISGRRRFIIGDIVPASLRNIKVKGVKYRPLQEKESRSSMWLALRGDRSSPQEEMFAILARSLGARFTR